MNTARVLLADDHRMVAEGLRTLLVADFDLVGIVEDGRALVEAARSLKPDVIVCDVSMPAMNGIDALLAVKRIDARVAFVMLTMHRDAVYARRALEAGALGYVLKHAAPTELVVAIRSALQGRTFVSPVLAGDVVDAFRHGAANAPDPVSTLTVRQREILVLLAEGHSAKVIGARLDISPRTVEFHKYHMMETLKLGSTAELIHFAIRNGLVIV